MLVSGLRVAEDTSDALSLNQHIQINENIRNSKIIRQIQQGQRIIHCKNIIRLCKLHEKSKAIKQSLEVYRNIDQFNEGYQFSIQFIDKTQR